MYIQLRLLLMFAIIMAASFIPEYNHELFGDWKCEGSGKVIKEISYGGVIYEKCNYAEFTYHNSMWHWGFRHYIWVIMGLTFTIINVHSIFNQKK